jgi:hypothetical protein
MANNPYSRESIERRLSTTKNAIAEEHSRSR